MGDGEKQSHVNHVFDHVAERYDMMNDFMSIGIHRAWKNALVASLAPSKTRPMRCLDVAGGTGDVAFRIVEASNHNAEAVVLDINGEMLEVGRDACH